MVYCHIEQVVAMMDMHEGIIDSFCQNVLVHFSRRVCREFHSSAYLLCLFLQIVDFCCGANDFSCLMKKRLDETGKKCYYKNYDVMQPKVSSIRSCYK